MTDHISIEDGRIRATTLSNGFRVITEHMPHVKSAALGVWVSVGSRNETLVETGLSHMLEHMAFKGTKRRTARGIVEEIEDVGGDLNAYTDLEITAYQARVLAEHTPLAIDIIADILRESTFLPDEIERERHVILQEIGERNDMPSMVAVEALQEIAFPDQPLGRPIIGTPDSVMSFDRDTVQGYMQRHYAPESMILSAAGFVDHDEVVRDAERLFGDMERRPASVIEPGHYHAATREIIKDSEQAHIVLGFEGPDSTDLEAQFRAQTAAAVLGGGMSSRLFQEAREERGLCYSIYSYAESFSDAGLMTIYAATGADQAWELATLALDVFERAADDVTEAEVSRARAQSKSGLVMGLESPMRRAETLARQMFLRGRPYGMSEIVEMIDAVDTTAVKRGMRELLDGGAPSAVYLGPKGGGLPQALRGAA